ncbi:unnamed protein product, partial [Heterosigma akashiwo]
MKIAIYSHSMLPTIDGVSRRFTQIINELVKQGHEVILFTLENKPEQIPGSVKYYTLLHMSIPNYPGKKLGKPSIVNMLYIASALHREQPDLIHCVSDALSSTFGLLGRAFMIPVVASIHTDIQTLGEKTKVPRFGRLCASLKEQSDGRLMDGCATTSPSFSEQLLSQGVVCDHALKTAVDVTMFHPSRATDSVREKLTFGNSDKLLAVFAGRLAPEKRLELCLALLDKLPDLYLAFIGDGPVGEKIAKFHGPEHRVYCVPGFASHAELAAVYASADVHLSFSTFETLGNTVLEAHAAGCPVVVPRAQGFRDTVRHGEDGFLFDAGPGVPEEAQVAEAAAFLERLARDPALGRALGEAGRRKVQGHTRELVVKDILQWYGTCTERQRRKSRSSMVFVFLQLVFMTISSIFF